MKRLLATLALLGLISLAWAQTNPLQDKVASRRLYRFESMGEDSVLYVDTDSISVDTLDTFRPGKWTSLMFSVNGTMGTGSIQAVAWCGSRYAAGELMLTPCDTLDIAATGRQLWQLNIKVSDVVMPVFSALPTVTSVTIDSTQLMTSW